MLLAVPLLLLAYVIAEIASIAILVDQLGGLNTAGVIGVGVLVGLMLLAGRTFSTLQDVVVALIERRPIAPVIVSSAIGGLAGILFLIPGVLSDAIAIVLLVPVVRRRAADSIASRVRAMTR